MKEIGDQLKSTTDQCEKFLEIKKEQDKQI